jgi:hypothetical protein
VVAILEDGSELRVRSLDPGVTYWVFMAEAVEALEQGQREAPGTFLTLATQGRAVSRVRVEQRRMLWEGSSVAYGAAESVAEFELAGRGSPDAGAAAP